MGILSQELSLKFGKAVYDHNDPTCPDLKDSVYLTPTSDDPFDPLQIACALGQKKRNNPPGKLRNTSKVYLIKNYSKVEKMSGVLIN